MMDEVKRSCGELPDQVLVDGGYVSADNLEKAQQHSVELIGPVPDTSTMVNKQAQQRGVSEACYKQAFRYDSESDTCICPEGKTLIHIKQRTREARGIEHEYRARRSDCAACMHKSECCPNANTCGRTVVRSEPNPWSKRFARRCRQKPTSSDTGNARRWPSSQCLAERETRDSAFPFARPRQGCHGEPVGRHHV